MAATSEWVFDNALTRGISAKRQATLDRILEELRPGLDLKTALDAGCGIGYFSKHLDDLGFDVTAIDARKDNILEAQRRYPQINFQVQDIEDQAIQKLGKFDFVLCFGLLYHLENPFRAVRNLEALTGRIAIIESMVAPGRRLSAMLVDEGVTEDQGLNYVALIPSESALVKMLYMAGFSDVYRVIQLPDHPEFHANVDFHRRRTVLVASRMSLDSPLLKRMKMSHQTEVQVWSKGLLTKGGLIRFAKRAKQSLQYRVLRKLPLPMRLPWGSWWIASNDVISNRLRVGKTFEQAEQSFLLKFLQPGMTVLDVGAHYGLYTMLASKRIGNQGRIIAFEPSPRENRKLQQHVRLNRLQNVRIESVAVGAENGTAELYVCLGQSTSFNSLRPPAVKEPTVRVEVPVVALDNYLEEAGIESVSFVKMDVEGAEWDVLKGAEKLLSGQNRPVFLCEVADLRTEAWGYRSVEIYDHFTKHGFRLFSVGLDGFLYVCHRKDEFVDDNLVAIPQEKYTAMLQFIRQPLDT